jgi:hypothetical protein
MQGTSLLARCCIALALLIGATSTSAAQSVNCSTGGNLQTAISSLSSGQTLTITGPCTGGPFYIGVSSVTLAAVGGGATINGTITVISTNVTLTGLTITGTGLAATSEGVTVLPFASVIISNCTIEDFDDGVRADEFGVASISGGLIADNTGNGINVIALGEASVGYVPTFAAGTSLPVEITGNGTGVQVNGAGTTLLNAANIHANTGAGVIVGRGGNAEIVGGTIANNGADGIDVNAAGIDFNATYFDASSPTTVTGNGGDGIKAESSSVTASNSDGPTISGNTGGPALQLVQSSAVVKNGGGTISSPAGLTQPTIAMLHSTIELFGPSLTVTGSGNSNAIYAVGNSTVTMHSATATDDDAADATIFVDDGSALFSVGGNTISNTGTSGIAIEVSNESTFHQHIATQFGQAAAADTITGTGSDQIESNIELGTGASTPSSWTGAITVAQSSTVRMDGGITVTGTVTITQASNGYFNTAATGQNIVTGGVSCPFADTAGARVAGAAKVLLSSGGASAVTIGNTSPDCQGF